MPTVSRNLRYGELTHVLEGAVTVVPGTEPATVRVVSVASGWSKEVGSFCDERGREARSSATLGGAPDMRTTDEME